MAIKRVVLKISNMTCAACEIRIENKVGAIAGVSSVKPSYNTGLVRITCDDALTSIKEIKKVIQKLHYEVVEKQPFEKKHSSSTVGIVLIVVAVYFVLNKFGLLNIIPQVDAKMGYFALFVVGLITSLHCTAMCGGINISQCMSFKETSNKSSALMPSFLYNAGRVVSYTVIGGIVGALGSVIGFSGSTKGFIALLAGAFMVIMGLNMLNIFPWLKRFTPRMPKIFGNKIHKKNNYGPFMVGLLNGLMPCGPLQAMQLYALGTGSMIAGATSMFFFSAGTVPLMFGLGALSSFLKGKATQSILQAGAVLVIVLGLAMFYNGMALSGFAFHLGGNETAANQSRNVATNYVNAATIDGNVQQITTKLGQSYTPITVQKGIPVRWTIQADKAAINGCNNEMQIPKYGFTKKLVPGDNIIEFTPTSSGKIPYSCWMGMIRSQITVVDDLSN